MSGAAPPKVFLSYAWGDDRHATRVEQLATDLLAAGVDVVYDQWDVLEGHDLTHFMERTANDASITHVLILLTPRYAEKADARHGGVGTETLIISPDVYADPQQTRYLPIIFGAQPGQATVPTYLKSRKYFDFSSAERWAAAWPMLLATLHGMRPRKPQLGPVPQQLLAAFTGQRAPAPPVLSQPSYQRLYQRLHDLFTWHGLDSLQAAALLEPFGFSLSALATLERTLDLLSEAALTFLTTLFQVDRAYLLGHTQTPGVEAGIWYKDVRAFCRRVATLHRAGQLESVRFVTYPGSAVTAPNSRRRGELNEDILVVLVLAHRVAEQAFHTYEVWEAGTWAYEPCRLDLKTMVLFCDRLAQRRMLYVAGGTFSATMFSGVHERTTHIAQVVGEGFWGKNWHPADDVSGAEHLMQTPSELPKVQERYVRFGLTELEASVTAEE